MKESPLDRVTFNKQQLRCLEQHFGSREALSKEITIDANLTLLNRKAGHQEVIDFVRERTL